MSFEIKYAYYDKNGEDYDKSQTKEIIKRLGTEFEDVPLEKLASSIISQLARRDIFITNVEINETVKRKISFKETKGGVVIKNKKFMLDGTVGIADEQPIDEAPPVESPKPLGRQIPPAPSDRAIRWEVYDPDQMLAVSLAKRYRLTQKKKYPILNERTVMSRVDLGGGPQEMPSYEYIVIDDQGQKIKIPSMHFVPEQKPLIGMENMPKQEYAPTLTHMGPNEMMNMPVLRR